MRHLYIWPEFAATGVNSVFRLMGQDGRYIILNLAVVNTQLASGTNIQSTPILDA
jgi:hypothetical protein